MKQIGKGSAFRQYYILFEDDAELPWWVEKFFSRKGFRHCTLTCAMERGSLLVSCTRMNVEVTWTDMPVVDVVRTYINAGAKAIYLPRALIEERRVRLGGLVPSCVGVCQVFTGLTFNAITPYHYYRSLLKHGRHEVM
jgi:hypothetical protein